MHGGRFERHSGALPLSAVVELHSYQRLILDVSKALYLQQWEGRQRTPKGFAEDGRLYLTKVEAGSAVPIMEREQPARPDLVASVNGDYFDMARRLVNDALHGVHADGYLLPEFPTDCLPTLARLGKTLTGVEAIELGDSPNDPRMAVLNSDSRSKLQELARLDVLEVEETQIGHVTGLAASKSGNTFFFEPVDSDHVLQGFYSDQSLFADLKGVLEPSSQGQLAQLTFVAEKAVDGSIKRIIDVLSLEGVLPAAWHQRLKELANVSQESIGADIERITSDALHMAERVLLELLDTLGERPGIFGSLHGGIQIEWDGDTSNGEIEVLNSGRVVVTVFPPDNSDPWAWESDFAAVSGLITDLREVLIGNATSAK